MPPKEPLTSSIPLLRPFRHRNFTIFFVGQAISMIGTWMANIAMGWLVYRLTKSATYLGIVSFLLNIPQFILGPYAGVIADRYDRLKVIKITQVVMFLQALVMAILTLTGVIQIWHIFVLSLLLGITFSMEIPSRQALIVKMVGIEDLPNAIGLNASLFNGARMIGPAIGGGIVALFGEGTCFLINAISFLALIAGLYIIDLGPWKGNGEHGSVWEHIKEGIKISYNDTCIRRTLALVAITSFFGMPFLVLLPAYIKTVLSGGVYAYGWVMASSGAGAMVAALTLVQRVTLKGLPLRIAVANICFGIGLVIFALMKNVYLAECVMFAASFAFMVQHASANTLIQMVVPDELRGRVLGLYAMMFLGTLPLGALLMGVATDKFGPQITFALMGICMLISGAIYFRFLPKLPDSNH